MSGVGANRLQMNKQVLWAFVALVLTGLQASGQTPILGRWKTIDDETGRVKSVVEITERDGKISGTIVELFMLPEEDQDPHCNLCQDDRKDQRVLGMEIVRGLVQDGQNLQWEDGTICDPENGKVYDCEMWINPGNMDELKVRGYILFLFRTQTWLRV
jgi:uncharacterized protein (DUF2147 family)